MHKGASVFRGQTLATPMIVQLEVSRTVYLFPLSINLHQASSTETIYFLNVWEKLHQSPFLSCQDCGQENFSSRWSQPQLVPKFQQSSWVLSNKAHVLTLGNALKSWSCICNCWEMERKGHWTWSHTDLVLTHSSATFQLHDRFLLG